MFPRLIVTSILLVAALAAASGPVKPTNERLATAIARGRQFLINNQTEAGNFHYEFDYRTLAPTGSADSPTRQAGALWGLASIHRHEPTPESERALLIGFRFFQKRMQATENGRTFLIYPGASRQGTGAMALLCLAYIDFLRAQNNLANQEKRRLLRELKAALSFLLSLRRADGQFYSHYTNAGKPLGEPSPYYDGESLLCMVKASRHAGFVELRRKALESAQRMYRVHVVDALRRHPDSPTTKGFYQWGSMAFYEISSGGWPQAEAFASRTIKLGCWMIDQHHVLRRTRNTAYAFEGLACAYQLAKQTGDREAMFKFRAAILVGLGKLLTWQVGGPAPNQYLQKSAVAPRSIGGVLNHAREPTLRIDVTQHQLHACILARKFVFAE